jgi:hypothetical protein
VCGVLSQNSKEKLKMEKTQPYDLSESLLSSKKISVKSVNDTETIATYEIRNENHTFGYFIKE